MKYVSTRFEGEDGKILILFIGLASGVGRLVFGRIADIPRVDRILLQQVRELWARQGGSGLGGGRARPSRSVARRLPGATEPRNWGLGLIKMIGFDPTSERPQCYFFESAPRRPFVFRRDGEITRLGDGIY